MTSLKKDQTSFIESLNTGPTIIGISTHTTPTMYIQHCGESISPLFRKQKGFFASYTYSYEGESENSEVNTEYVSSCILGPFDFSPCL